MDRLELTKIRVQLYKATPLKLQLVDELISLIKGCFGNHIKVNGIRFDNRHFQLGGLTVKMIEIDPQEIGGVLIHWYPNFKISTRQDPYCSVYILKTNSIRKLIKEIQIIHDSYLQNQ